MQILCFNKKKFKIVLKKYRKKLLNEIEKWEFNFMTY